jgi:hypothetical protein
LGRDVAPTTNPERAHRSNRATEPLRAPVVARRLCRSRRRLGCEAGTPTHAPDICCHPHSEFLRCHVLRFNVDAQDSGSEDSFTQAALTQTSNSDAALDPIQGKVEDVKIA